MKKWMGYLRHFYADKCYMLVLSLTALCSYGFFVTHSTVGIDDTPYAYYFEDGLAAIVGRWVLFLLNKAVDIGEFAPFLTDLAGVLILMAAVTVWCALFYSLLGDALPGTGYLLFASIFLSCPLLSEVFPYYLHNGVALGYLFCGVSLCFFREGLTGKSFRFFGGSALFLWMALGCYESFMTVWLCGLCLSLLSGRFVKLKYRVLPSIGMGVLSAVAALVLRSLMIAAVTGIFGLEAMKNEAVQRSVGEMAAWIFKPGAFAEFAMVLKRIFAMYVVFAYAYYPILIFVLAAAVLFGFCLYRAIRQRDFWIFLLCLGAFGASFLLVIVEGKATLYRSAQFLPVLCGYGALLLVYASRGCWSKKGKGPGTALRSCGKYGVTAILSIVLWNQCADMNRWFYVDYLKYEDAKETIGRISYEIEKNFDSEKPVVFTGTYQIPRSIVQGAYVPFGSETYYKMQRLASLADPQLLEKFYREYGVWVAQTPSLSVIDWGRYAFGDDSELVRFAAMHGFELTPLLDRDYAPIEEYAKSLPRFPAEGSVVDAGEYIVVHF